MTKQLNLSLQNELLSLFEYLPGVKVASFQSNSLSNSVSNSGDTAGDDFVSVKVIYYEKGAEADIVAVLQRVELTGLVLFHGNNAEKAFVPLRPRKADNLASSKHGNLEAVYATSLFRESVYYALIDTKYLRGSDTQSIFGIGTSIKNSLVTYQINASGKAYKKMSLNDPHMFGTGWLYILDKNNFKQEEFGSPEHHSEQEEIPLLIMRLTPSLAQYEFDRGLANGTVTVSERIITDEEKQRLAKL